MRAGGRTLPVAKSGLKQDRRCNAGREGTPVLTVVQERIVGEEPAASGSLIDEIVREGARRMLAEALQAEVDAYIARFAGERDEQRPPAGGAQRLPRAAGGADRGGRGRGDRAAGQRQAHRPGDRRAERFSSAILPPWCRKTPKITEVLPLLYLHGLSSGDFVPALGQFLGSSAGLSAPVITRLTETWKAEQRAFAARDLSQRGLRLPVGRRDPRQHPPRGAQAVPAGDDRRARRRAQGAHRPRRRLPGVGRVVGGPAARLRPPRHARPGARGRRRRARVLGRPARGLPRRPGSSAAGSTRSPTSWPRCPSPPIRARRRRWRRSGTPRTSRTPSTP